MSKFTVQINNLSLNKTTQDLRILRMKIWLHFREIINEAEKNKKHKEGSHGHAEESDSDGEYKFSHKAKKPVKSTDLPFNKIADI